MVQFTYLTAALAALVLVGAKGESAPQRRDRISRRAVESRDHYHNGKIRPFTQQGGYGSCGLLNDDNDLVVAVSYKLQGKAWPPMYCGRRVQVAHEGVDQNEDGSPKDRIIQAVIVDTCTTCDSSHLELSVGAFEKLVGGTWDNPGPIGNIRWDVLD